MVVMKILVGSLQGQRRPLGARESAARCLRLQRTMSTMGLPPSEQPQHTEALPGMSFCAFAIEICKPSA